MKGLITKIKLLTSKVKRQLLVLHLAYQDHRTPWFAKALIFLTLAYALSPIDLIPDFIPVIGLLDDLILLPIGIFFAIKLIPAEVIEEAKEKAKYNRWKKKKNYLVAVFILIIWILIILTVVQRIRQNI